MGAGPLLCVEQAVLLETDATKARQIARGFLNVYLGLPNYTNMSAFRRCPRILKALPLRVWRELAGALIH